MPVQPMPTSGPHTWAEFIALPDDDRRELIDGHLIEVEVPTQLHELIVAHILACLWNWAQATGSGSVLGSGYKVRINPKRGVMPDVQFFKTGHLPPEEQQGLETGRPDLAVEVISPSSRTIDRLTKLNWYAAKVVPEYWIVDPDQRTLERHILRRGHYFVEPFGETAIFTPETFPGLKIPLASLWPGPHPPARKRRR